MTRRAAIRTSPGWLLLIVVALLAASCTSDGGPGSSTTVPGTTDLPPTTAPGPGSTTAPPTTSPRPTVPVPTSIDGTGFNDHSVPVINSLGEFFALAREGAAGRSVVKFTIVNMALDPEIRWLDSRFYTLHDEWYWFRLINGAAVPGATAKPLKGMRFATVAQIYDWARSLRPGELPYDLIWVASQSVGSRLYSDDFYDLALNVTPRVYGLGSVVYFPESAAGGGERWVIELEYHDDPEPAEVAQFFRVVAGSVPAEIADRLEWVVRSPAQDRVARVMAASRLPFHDRVVRYSELVEPGEVAVYNPGIAAGRLLLIGEGGRALSDAGEDDILLVENVPDWLPPGRALISSSPQTPLAHVNILARNRGIPNASQAGIVHDAGIRQAARVRAPAVVRASGTDSLEVVLITEEQYAGWQSRNAVNPIAVEPADLAGESNVVNLASITSVDDAADIARWRRIIGGKAAGFLHLMAASAVTLPDDPVAITVKPYREHLSGLEPALAAMLNDTGFRASARTRFLMLEGATAYVDFYTQPSDQEHARQLAVEHPAGTPIGDILRAGGFKSYLRDVPMNPATLRDIAATLQVTYGDYALSQGLRFRSSSTVEDIEGFNGAGLYESNTGFLRPDVQIDGGDHKKTIEWALKKTWSSYWGFEAFEERRREGVDHRSGAMAVLVHARFDDPLERSNGVLTFTILPGGAAGGYEMMVNAQQGDVAVTNPDPTLRATPEVVVVRSGAGAGDLRIERVASSSLMPAGGRVLDAAKLASIFEQARAVAHVWRDRENAALPAAQRIEVLTLDFEFVEMADGWPALKGGLASLPGRIVIKQARTLEPGLRDFPRAVRELPIPRDILMRARLVQRVVCPTAGAGTATEIAVLTDPLLGPEMGYSLEPFVVVEVAGAARPGVECSRETLYSTPDQYLFDLLQAGELLNLSR